MTPAERAVLELVTETLEALGRDAANLGAPMDVLAEIARVIGMARAVLDSPVPRDVVD